METAKGGVSVEWGSGGEAGGEAEIILVERERDRGKTDELVSSLAEEVEECLVETLSSKLGEIKSFFLRLFRCSRGGSSAADDCLYCVGRMARGGGVGPSSSL